VLIAQSCCPGRPVHNRSRAFFKAAATLALVVAGLRGPLGTPAKADYLNPLGNTAGSGFSQNGASISSATNAGVINTGFYGIANWGSSSITTVINSGTMNVSGYGIANFSSSMGTVTNSGTINTHNYAVANFDASTTMGSFLNSGTINASSAYAFANFSGATITTFTNSGTISSAFCAVKNDNSFITNLTNSGTLSGGGGYAIMNNGTIGTLTLAAGSHTNGGIQNDGDIGTLNIIAGAVITGNIANTGTITTLNVSAVATSANFDLNNLGATITGNQPLNTNLDLSAPSTTAYVVIGGHAAGVDKSAFGASAASVRQFSGSVSRLANTNGLVESIGAKAAKHAGEPYAMTSDLCVDGAPAQAAQTGNSDFWIRGFMGRNQVDASASSVDYVNTYSGGAVGIERDWTDDVRAGAFIGAGNMKNSLGSGLGGSDADLIFLGTHATKTWGTLFAKVGLTGGRGSNTGTRNIAAGAPEIATADYKNWYVSPEVSVGKVYDLGQHLGGSLSVTPVLSVRYVYASQDGYTETGATNNLTMNKSHSTTIEERAELKFSYATKAFNDYGVKVNASVGGIGQQNNGGAMSGTLLGAPLSFATPGDDNTTGFVGGLGFEINRGKYTFTASGDYVRLSGGNADLSANVILSVKF
jgi:outer membrane autotransporter protein